MTDVPFDSLESFIAEYYRRNPDGHYFDPEMLEYFEEDKALIRVINRAMMLATDMFGNGPFKPYYVLVRPPKAKYQVETWDCVLFDAETFRPITSEFAPRTEQQEAVQNAIKREIWLS